MEYLTFPRARLPLFADCWGICSRMDAWERFTGQIEERLDGESLGDIAGVFARVFSLMGNCRRPPEYCFHYGSRMVRYLEFD